MRRLISVLLVISLVAEILPAKRFDSWNQGSPRRAISRQCPVVFTCQTLAEEILCARKQISPAEYVGRQLRNYITESEKDHPDPSALQFSDVVSGDRQVGDNSTPHLALSFSLMSAGTFFSLAGEQAAGAFLTLMGLFSAVRVFMSGILGGDDGALTDKQSPEALAKQAYGDGDLPGRLQEKTFHRAQQTARYAREMYAVLNREIPPDVEAAAYLYLPMPTSAKAAKKKSAKTMALIQNLGVVQQFLYQPPLINVSKKKTRGYRQFNLRRHMNMVVSELESFDVLVLVVAARLAALENPNTNNHADVYRDINLVYARLFARLGSYALCHYVLDKAFEIAEPRDRQTTLQKIDSMTGMSPDERQAYVTNSARLMAYVNNHYRVISSVKGAYSFRSKVFLKESYEEIQDLLRFSVILQKPEALHDSLTHIIEKTGWALPPELNSELEPKFRDDHFPLHITLESTQGKIKLYHEIQFFKNETHYYNYKYGDNAQWIYKVEQETGQSFEGYERYDVTDDPVQNFQLLKKAVAHWVYFRSLEQNGVLSYSTLSIPRRRDGTPGNVADVAALHVTGGLQKHFMGFLTGDARFDPLGILTIQTKTPHPPYKLVRNGELIWMEPLNAQLPEEKARASLTRALESASSPEAIVQLARIVIPGFPSKHAKDGMRILKQHLGLASLQGDFSAEFLSQVMGPMAKDHDLSVNELFAAFSLNQKPRSLAIWDEIASIAQRRGETSLTNFFVQRAIPSRLTDSPVVKEAIAESYGLQSITAVGVAIGAGLISVEDLTGRWKGINPRMATVLDPDPGEVKFDMRIPDQPGLLAGVSSCVRAAKVELLELDSPSVPNNSVKNYPMVDIHLRAKGNDEQRAALLSNLKELHHTMGVLNQKLPTYVSAQGVFTWRTSNPEAEWEIIRHLAQSKINLEITRTKPNSLEMRLGLPPQPDFNDFINETEKLLSVIPGVEIAHIKLLKKSRQTGSRLRAQERLEGLAIAAGFGALSGISMALMAHGMEHLNLNVIELKIIFRNYMGAIVLGLVMIWMGNSVAEIVHEWGHILAARQTYPQAGLWRWRPWGDLIVLKDKTNQDNPSVLDDGQNLAAGRATSRIATVQGALVLAIIFGLAFGLLQGSPRSSMTLLISLIELVVFLAAFTGGAFRHRSADQTAPRLRVADGSTYQRSFAISHNAVALLLTLFQELQAKNWKIAPGFQIEKQSDELFDVTVEVFARDDQPGFWNLERQSEAIYERYRQSSGHLQEMGSAAAKNAHRLLLDIKLRNPSALNSVVAVLIEKELIIESIKPVPAVKGQYHCVLVSPDLIPVAGQARDARPTALIEKALRDLQGVTGAKITDFSRLRVDYEDGAISLTHSQNQVGVLEKILTVLKMKGWNLRTLVQRSGSGGTFRTEMRVQKTNAERGETGDLINALHHIELSPTERFLTRKHKLLTLSFDLLDTPDHGALLRVVNMLVSRKVNIEEEADLRENPDNPRYGRVELVVATDLSIEELEDAMIGLKGWSTDGSGRTPLEFLRNIEVAVNDVSRASAMEVARRIREKLAQELTPIGWTDVRLIHPMIEIPGEPEGELDEDIFLPNWETADRIASQAHSNPYRKESNDWFAKFKTTLFMNFPVWLPVPAGWADNWPPAEPHYREVPLAEGKSNPPYMMHPRETAFNMIALGERDELAIIEADLHDVIEDGKKQVWRKLESLIRVARIGGIHRNQRETLRQFRRHFPESKELLLELEKSLTGKGTFSSEKRADLKVRIYRSVEELAYAKIRREVRRYPETVISDLKDLSQHEDYDSYAENLQRRNKRRQKRLKLTEQAHNLSTLSAGKRWKIVAKNIRYYLPAALSEVFLLNDRDRPFAHHFLQALVTQSLRLKSLDPYVGDMREAGKKEDEDSAKTKMLLSLDQSLKALRNPGLISFLPVEKLGKEALDKFTSQLDELRAALASHPGRTAKNFERVINGGA